MLRKFKIINVTDHYIGFRIWDHKNNAADYNTEPSAGILSPQCTQSIKVRRTPGKNETENMECKDKIFVWNGIVAEGIQASDISTYLCDSLNECKELPVVLITKVSSLICQFQVSIYSPAPQKVSEVSTMDNYITLNDRTNSYALCIYSDSLEKEVDGTIGMVKPLGCKGSRR
jgi:hypothetical protein